jgi:hypothetical protein
MVSILPSENDFSSIKAHYFIVVYNDDGRAVLFTPQPTSKTSVGNA